MLEDEFVTHSLETLNLEAILLKESNEYRIGRRIMNLKNAFPDKIFSLFYRHVKDTNIEKKALKISEHKPIEEIYYADPKRSYYSGVAYTCITNHYDAVKDPLYIDNHLDYLLFSDEDRDESAIWQYRSLIDYNTPVLKNDVNRYYKMHPFKYLSQYEFSIYIDGNVQLVSDVSSLFSIARDSSIGIAMHRHATQNCAYKNAQLCLYSGRGNKGNLKKQILRYKEEGFPEEFGLLEATVLVVDMKNDKAKKILDDWWNEYRRSGSGRDQISLPYVIWKNGHKIDDVGDLGNDEYHNPKFRIYKHEGKLI